ncbi:MULTISPECIES: DUF6188 family protein [Bacillaceae]|uniref:DUF6188 family protein n=1 Tax=Bacillaceae TaxID=186817 RepID=UPI001046F507|nr:MULTISPECIES: DUF6188 family protein [Bacillaceae]MDT2046308.1 DUF6188 family protein [Priestia flexa]TDB50008.1 hypothetical protein EPL02_13100 [Bacillus sp. CBEL-1]
MNKEQQAMDFTYFYGQQVINIIHQYDNPLSLEFSNGGLVIECPWRLKKGDDVIAGQADWKLNTSFEWRYHITKKLLGKQINNIVWYEDLNILRVYLTEDYLLDLFQDSAMFEGWDLHGENGFSFISLPGGSMDYVPKNVY